MLMVARCSQFITISSVAVAMSTPRRRNSAATMVSPMLVLVLMILMLSPTVVSWCPRLGDSCGPAYHCCECNPSDGRKLYCDVQWGKGFVCGTYAFEPTCGSGLSCNSDGACQPYSQLKERVWDAFGMPGRKMSKLEK